MFLCLFEGVCHPLPQLTAVICRGARPSFVFEPAICQALSPGSHSLGDFGRAFVDLVASCVQLCGQGVWYVWGLV
jgi:hypothetical protein